MAQIKKRIENLFTSAARWIYRHPLLVLGVVLLMTAGVVSQLPKLTINTSNEGFLHDRDPILKQYNQFKDQFGRDDFIVVAIQSPQIFTQEFLTSLKKLHDELEENLPHVEEVLSLVNARNTKGEGDRLVVDDLLQKWPATEMELEALKATVMANPLYINRLISADASFTTLLIKTDTYARVDDDSAALAGFDDQDAAQPVKTAGYITDRQNSAVVLAVQEISKKYQADDFRIFIAGSPVVTDFVKKSMMRDMPLFMRLALLLVGICLFAIFRRVSGVILPILIVGLSIVATLGLMAATSTQFKVPTIILPSFLMAVGVGGCVHVLALFFHRFNETADREESIVYAMGHSGLAVVMTSLTTAAGLASFASAEVAPIADLGLFSSIGVLIALVYTIIMLPALLALIPIKNKNHRHDTGVPHDHLFDRFLTWVASFSTRHPKLITGVSLAVIAFFALGASKLHFRHDILSWLPEKLPVREATKTIDAEMRGTVALEVVIDTGRENGLYDRALLESLERLTAEISTYQEGDLFVGKVFSVVDLLKEIHQALHANNPEFYKVPENQALIPQEFLLFENSGSDDLEDVVDSRFQLARFTVKLPWFDAIKYIPFMGQIEKRFASEMHGQASVTMTGIMSLFARIINAAIHSAAQSYGIAVLVITLMMILLIGDLRLGLLSMLPNLGPIVVIMGIMGWLDLSLDMFTMLIASIAIGLAVDDTIHFMYNFRRYYQEHDDAVAAVHWTLHTSGRAMLVTSIVLSIGFFIFMFSTMSNVFYFGLLTGISIILALGADFLFSPALVMLATGTRAGHVPNKPMPN